MSEKSKPVASIHSALRILGRDPKAQESDTKPTLVPTAAARQALDFLTHSTSESLQGVDLRKTAEAIYNWAEPEQNKVTRPIVRTFNKILHTPGRYHQAVELIAFTAALAPLLHTDRINNILQIAPTIETAFNPDRYTIQLHGLLRKVFSQYPEARIERLAIDLWKRAHKGRWWNITLEEEHEYEDAGVADIDPNSSDFINQLINTGYNWSPLMAEKLSEIEFNEDLRVHILNYNREIKEGTPLDPDIALLASHLSWLSFEERPESPIASLLRSLVAYIDGIEGFRLPDKPSTFAKLFPGLELVGATRFPYPNSIIASNGAPLGSGRLQLVMNLAMLAANATEMGNCTNSFSERMLRGTYVLFRIIDEDGSIYNASLILGNNNRWRLGEMNSRFNRGNVPPNLRRSFENFIDALPEYQADNLAVAAAQNSNVKYAFSI